MLRSELSAIYLKSLYLKWRYLSFHPQAKTTILLENHNFRQIIAKIYRVLEKTYQSMQKFKPIGATSVELSCDKKKQHTHTHTHTDARTHAHMHICVAAHSISLSCSHPSYFARRKRAHSFLTAYNIFHVWRT